MDRRLQREVERSKSVLYKTRGLKGVDVGLEAPIRVAGTKGTNGYTGGGGVMEEEERRGKGEEGLSEEQMQMFKEENEGMLRHYEDTLDQVRWVLSFLHPRLCLQVARYNIADTASHLARRRSQ